MAIYHSNHKKLECKGEFNSISQYSKDNYSKVHTLKVDRIITISSLGLLGLTISSGVILSSSIVSADDASTVDEVNITVPVSCTMSGTGMESHNAEIVNGTYTPDIGSTTLHAFCNDNEGFAIYAAGYTGNEVGGTNSNKLVGTTASNNATIESGIATTAGNPDISNWAMKLTMTQDSGDTTADNAFTIDSAPNEALPSQAESGAAQAPFSNYHVVPNEYVKVAHKNSGTDMTETTGGVKLTTTYAAYISKTQPADTYSGQVIYTLVHPASANKPVIPVSIENITYMQDLAKLSSEQISGLKDSMTEDTQYQMVDSRDNKTYYVAKLRDGNIWMTQNLDLDLESVPTNVSPLTSENTDLPTGTSWNPIRSTYVSSNTEWINSYTTPESYDPGEGNQINDQHYAKGNYYNWTAAVAMNDSSDYSYEHGYELSPNQSICPAGWTLPLVRENPGSFYTLLSAYGFADYPWTDAGDVWSAPLYFTINESYHGSSVSSGGEVNLWSAVSGRGLNIGDEWVNGTNDGYGNNSGLGIRCLVR